VVQSKGSSFDLNCLSVNILLVGTEREGKQEGKKNRRTFEWNRRNVATVFVGKIGNVLNERVNFGLKIDWKKSSNLVHNGTQEDGKQGNTLGRWRGIRLWLTFGFFLLGLLTFHFLFRFGRVSSVGLLGLLIGFFL
jgi:hypothetical protein